MTERTPAEQARAVADTLRGLFSGDWREGLGPTLEETLLATRDAANAVAEYLERQPAREPDAYNVYHRTRGGGEWKLALTAMMLGPEEADNRVAMIRREYPSLECEARPVYIGEYTTPCTTYFADEVSR